MDSLEKGSELVSEHQPMGIDDVGLEEGVVYSTATIKRGVNGRSKKKAQGHDDREHSGESVDIPSTGEQPLDSITSTDSGMTSGYSSMVSTASSSPSSVTSIYPPETLGTTFRRTFHQLFENISITEEDSAIVQDDSEPEEDDNHDEDEVFSSDDTLEENEDGGDQAESEELRKSAELCLRVKHQYDAEVVRAVSKIFDLKLTEINIDTEPQSQNSTPESTLCRNVPGILGSIQSSSEASNPTEASAVSEGAAEGPDRDYDSTGGRKSVTPSVFKRLFKLSSSGRKYAYKAQPGELHASEITMSNQELADILIKVKEGKLNQDDAVREVKRYELEKREKDSLSTGSQSSESSMLSTPHSSPRVLCPARQVRVDLFTASGLRPPQNLPPLPSPSPSKKSKAGSKASPLTLLKALFSGGKHQSGQAREDPGARNYFDSHQRGSPSRTKSQKAKFSSPAASPSRPRKGSSPDVGSPRHKPKFLQNIFRRGSGDSKSSESMKLSLKSDTASKKGSDSESVSSSGIPSPRRAGVNSSVSQPSGMGDQETHDIQRSVSEGATLPLDPRRGSTESPSSGSPCIPRRTGPLPDPPRQVLQTGKFKNNDDYAPSYWEVEVDIHPVGKSRSQERAPRGGSIRDHVDSKNIKNGGKPMQIKGEIDFEGDDDRGGRSPKRRTTPPDSQSPKRQHISPNSHHQVSSPDQTLIDIPEGHRSEKQTEILLVAKDDSPDACTEVSPTSTLDSVDMKDSKYGSASSTMSIGSEGSPTLCRQKGKVSREKSKLRRQLSNTCSLSTEDETMSSDHEEVRPFARDSDERRSITEIKKDEKKRRSGHKEHSRAPDSAVTVGSPGYPQASSSSSSISVEEEGGSKKMFVAVAKANTDSIPSPYDTEALAFKKGDIVHILSKNPSGIWKGMVNNRIGEVKFIHMDLLPEFPEARQRPTRSTFVRRSYRRPRPKTVEELLKRLGLPHVLNKFLFHGFETLELFSHLEEGDLDILELSDPEERTKLLTVASLLGDESRYLNLPFATALFEDESIDSD